MNNWLVYILECSDGTYYCGCTNNLERRLSVHNSGKGAKYTKTRLPVKIIMHSKSMNRSEACKLEYKVKKCKRKDKIAFLEKYL